MYLGFLFLSKTLNISEKSGETIRKSEYGETIRNPDRVNSIIWWQHKSAELSKSRLTITVLSMKRFSEGSIGDSVGEREGGFALVINGHSLVYALQPDLELLFIGKLLKKFLHKIRD